MRYLVCSDIHLNVVRRFEDTLAALEQIFTLSRKLDVEKILILGDVYTSRRPHSKEKTEFQRWVRRITEPYERFIGEVVKRTQIEVVILKGNHDEYPDGTHSYSEFTELDIPNVVVHDNPAIVDNFFLGHMLLREAKLGPTDYQLSNCMSTKELIQKYPGVKAYLLGDVHKAQVIQKDPLVLYAGSINRVDFGERDDEKSVLLIDDDPELKCKRIVLKSRAMLQVDEDIRGMWAPPDTERWYPKHEIEGSIFKYVCHGTPEELKQVDEMKLRELFKSTKEFIIQYKVRRESIARDERVTENITPQQALAMYLENFDLQPEERAAIVELSNKVMEDAAA